MLPQHRRHSRFALFPLSIIAAVFVLPTWRSCGTSAYESPAHFASADLFSAFWILPVFAAATVLAVLTLRAVFRREVSRTVRRLGLATLAVFAATSLASAVFMFDPKSASDVALSAAPFLSAGMAAMLVRRARGRAPWEMWEHLLAAFAVLGTGCAPTVLIAGELVSNGGIALGPGAYIYLGALALLGLITTRAVTDSVS